MTESNKLKLSYLEDPILSLEIMNTICGDLIGQGCYRDVYEYSVDPKFVIKVENSDGDGSNWVEWRVWNTVKFTTDGTKDWFAPCSWISNNGRLLLQRKTQPLYSREKHIPEKIPAYFTDVKDSNFGWIGKQLVSHDYSLCLERFGYFALKNKMQPFKSKL